MKRRDFIKKTGMALSLPLALNSLPVSAFAQSSWLARLTGAGTESDRVLVLVQLNGGNDGLNTVIPLDQYGNLTNVRANVIIPENSVIPVGGNVGFHPAMEAMKSLYDDRKVGIIRGVGYPNPNFSHFRSTDIMVSASDSDVFEDTGWLGRYLDKGYPGYPDEYPNETTPDPLAITIGSIASNTCQGPITNMGIAINNSEASYQVGGGSSGTAPDSPYGYELNYIRDVQLLTEQYLEVVSAAAEAGSNLSSLYDINNELAQQLRVVAQLISGGLKTRVYVVSLGGFDTHADQVQAGTGNQTGFHAELLRMLSEAVFAFQDDLSRHGLEDRVVGMTFSEFGRRIQSNFSLGTDHGTTGPVFVFGSQVNPRFLGTNPEIPAVVGVEDNLPLQFDFRAVYGSILKDWFCVDEADIRQLLFGDFEYLPIIGNSVTGRQEELVSEAVLSNYPNPFGSSTQITLQSSGNYAEVTVLNAQGRLVSQLHRGYLAQGEQRLALDARQLRPGSYLCLFRQDNKVFVRRLLRQ